MVRRKIKIKRIENATTRQVSFSKRRGGLLKKAHDLSVLCDVDLGVVIFSGKGKLFQFANPSMKIILERYVKWNGDSKAPANNSSSDNVETDRLTQFTEKLNTLQSNLIGDDLERLSLRDLIQLEQQFHGHLGCIRAKKEELLLEQLEELKEKVTEAPRTTNGNSNILEKLVDFGLSEMTGSGNSGSQGDSEHRDHQVAPLSDSLPFYRVDMSEQTNQDLPTPKRSILAQDLNKQPARTEE